MHSQQLPSVRQRLRCCKHEIRLSVPISQKKKGLGLQGSFNQKEKVARQKLVGLADNGKTRQRLEIKETITAGLSQPYSRRCSLE